MHDACRDGYSDIIRFLLSKKPDITVQNNGGKTPLEELKSGIDGRDEILKLFSDFQTQGIEFLKTLNSTNTIHTGL